MNLNLRNRRLVLFAIVALGLLIGGYGAYWFNARSMTAKPAMGPIVVETATVKAELLEETITAVGGLRATQAVVLKSELAARIAKIHFLDGSSVSKDQELISFESAIQQAQVNQARAERDLAAAKLKRTQELFDKKFLSAAALDDARANHEIAQARLALAQASLDKLSLRAPFDGVIGIRQVSVGDYIKEGTELVNLEDMSAMKVDFRVPEQALSRVAVGQQVMLETDVFPSQKFPAKVVALDSTIDAAGRSLLIRAELRDATRRLKPGMFMRVKLILATKPKALVIPEEALVTAQGSLFVFKIVDGKASRVTLKTGLRVTRGGETVVEVLEGLAEGDTVVRAGQIKIRGDNVPVKPATP